MFLHHMSGMTLYSKQVANNLCRVLNNFGERKISLGRLSMPDDLFGLALFNALLVSSSDNGALRSSAGKLSAWSISVT